MDAVERVRITGIAAGGAGVGRLPDGRAVFVHRTAPGEEADVRVVESRVRWARAQLVTLRSRSPDRRTAPCPHYERCGGCTLEHLAYDAQLAAKAAIVGEAIRRIGRIETGRPGIEPSPSEFRYRNRLSLTLERGARGVRAGFHEIDRPGEILDIDGSCLLPEPALAHALDALRTAWGDRADRLPAGRRLRLTLRATERGRVTLLIEGGDDAGDAAALRGAVPPLDSVWQRTHPGTAAVLLDGEPTSEERWAGEDVPLRGGMFLQVNRRAAAALEAHVLERAGDVRGRRVVDAYAGIGTLARALAARGAGVTAIELDSAAVSVGRALGGDVQWIDGRVEDHLEAALPADLVLVNPPRAGMENRAARALAARPPGRLLYVSCDPATLARDLSRLDPTLRLRATRCFDLFPQTSHVETVAELACDTS